MNIPILTAVGDPRVESDLSAGLGDPEHGVVVVRRCVDLADLLAAAAAGLARAAVLSADLRRLDGEALSRLHDGGVAVVGLVAAGDEAAERRVRQLGVRHVLPHDAPSNVVAAALHAALDELAEPLAEPPEPTPAADPALVVAEHTATVTGAGRVVAVWGPAGAPGRSTVAVSLAAELAVAGHSVLLVDVDTYGGAVGQLLGLLDEAPGIAAACRLANAGSLDVARLADVALQVRPLLRVLTGIVRPDRWPELRAPALATVLELARSVASYVVVDCGFCLEQQEELSFDTVAPRRNAATLTAIGAADLVLGVSAADPIGLARYVRALPECVALGPSSVITVANRLRRGVVGAGEPRRQVVSALERYAGIADVHVIPEDREAVDEAIAAGRTLAEVAPKSAARVAIRGLADRVVLSVGDTARAPGARPIGRAPRRGRPPAEACARRRTSPRAGSRH